MQTTHTLIIGGGISGLYAALRLQQQGIPYLLLEAKARLGGRIFSQAIVEGLAQKTGLLVDLGPTWFWPHQTRMQNLLQDLQLSYFEQYTAGDALYQMHPEQQPRRSAGVGAMLSYRVKGGMQNLITALAERLPASGLKTSHEVRQIQKVEEQWRLTATHQSSSQIFQAQNLVLALPPRMITSTLKPEGTLSTELIHNLQQQQTWMSAQAKFVAVYKRPFWREQGLAGQAFSQVGPMVEIHDASAASEAGHALFGFIGVPWSQRKQVASEQLKDACLAQLQSIFGPEAGKSEGAYLKDWATDPWVASEQDRLESPQHAEFSMALFNQELASLKLHLVGSEFAPQEAGYLEGALLAVEQALTNMQR